MEHITKTGDCLIVCGITVSHRALYKDHFFFLIYVNDLNDALNCNVRLFNDVISIFTIFNDPYTATLDINFDMNLTKL